MGNDTRVDREGLVTMVTRKKYEVIVADGELRVRVEFGSDGNILFVWVGQKSFEQGDYMYKEVIINGQVGNDILLRLAQMSVKAQEKMEHILKGAKET